MSGRHLETGAGPRLMFCPTFAAWSHSPDRRHNIMEAMASFRSRNFATTIPIARPGCAQPASLAYPAMMISMVSPHMAWVPITSQSDAGGAAVRPRHSSSQQ